MLLLDLGVFHKDDHIVTFKEAGFWTCIWVSLAVAFGIFIFFGAELIHGVHTQEQLIGVYQEEMISERHRHRYEVNNEYREVLSQNGMIFCGTSPNDSIVEMIELPDHPWFVACQFHPEFKSRPNRPHPLFMGFMHAAVAQKR